MKKLLGIALLTLGGWGAGVTTASAANIVANATAELRPWMRFDATTGPMIAWPYFALDAPVQVSVGDVVEVNLRFAPGQSITMHSNGGTQYAFADIFLSPNEPANSSSFSVSNGTLTLLDAGGQAVHASTVPQQSNGFSDIGLAVWWSDVPAGSSITFSGYRATFTVESLQDGTKNYSTAGVYFGSLDGADVVINAAPVPEPGTWAFMLLGLTGIGALRARAAAPKR